jgi:hypothetical protein
MGKGAAGGKAKDYYGSIAGVICAGPVDALVAIIIDSKTVWPKSRFWTHGELVQAETPTSAGFLRVWGGRCYECILAHFCDLTNAPPNPTYWKLFFVRAADVSNPFKATVENYGEAWIYWGTDNQELVTSTARSPKKAQPPENIFAQTHPPYRRQCWIFLRNFLFGTERTQSPNVEVVVRRRPQSPTALAEAPLDEDGQANPVTFEAELLTNPVFGAGIDPARLDVSTWDNEAAYAALNYKNLYLSPRIAESVTLRAVLPESFQYRDGWARYNTAGKIELGHFAHNQGAPPATPETTVDFNVATQPLEFTADTMGAAVTEVLIKYTAGLLAFKESSIRLFSGASREIIGQSRVTTIERPWINRPEQAFAVGAVAANLAGEPPLGGSFDLRAERGAAILPGNLFLLTHDALNLSLWCRCTARTIANDGAGTVRIEFERERGLSELPFQPTVTPEQGPTPPPVEIITQHHIFQPPPGLVKQAGYFVAILAARLDPLTIGFRPWFRKEETEAFYELSEGIQKNFAVTGTLAAPYAANLPAAGTSPPDDDTWTLAVALNAATVDSDEEKINATQTADAIGDDNLLIGIFSAGTFELMTVKEIRTAANGNLELRVRRARFGTPQAAWPLGATAFIFYRLDLVFYTHAKFLEYAKTGEQANFRLEGRNPFAIADISDAVQCPDIPFNFADTFTPDVAWISIQWRSTPAGTYAEVSDFNQNFDPAGQWKVTARFTDPDGDLADGRIYARIGAVEQPIWAQTFAGTSRQVEAEFQLAAGDWQVFGRVRDLTDRSRERGLTIPAGGPVLTLKIHTSAPATVTANPVVSPKGGTFITGTTVTITSSTPGATIHYYQFNALFAPPPQDSSFFVGSSPVTVVVNLNATLYCYATATGLQRSAMVQEDYEGPK